MMVSPMVDGSVVHWVAEMVVQMVVQWAEKRVVVKVD